MVGFTMGGAASLFKWHGCCPLLLTANVPWALCVRYARPTCMYKSGQPERAAASGLRVGTLGLVLGLETGVVLACETRHLSMSRAWAHWGPRVVVKSDGSA